MYSPGSIKKILFILFLLVGSTFVYAQMEDPTKPPGHSTEFIQDNKTESIKDLILEAVLISENTRFAIINNTLVKIGDKIGDAEVKAIGSSGVTLLSKQGERVLHLFGKPIKEPIK